VRKFVSIRGGERRGIVRGIEEGNFIRCPTAVEGLGSISKLSGEEERLSSRGKIRAKGAEKKKRNCALVASGFLCRTRREPER